MSEPKKIPTVLTFYASSHHAQRIVKCSSYKMIQFVGRSASSSIVRCSTLAGHVATSCRRFSTANLQNLLVDKRSTGVALITYVTLYQFISI